MPYSRFGHPMFRAWYGKDGPQNYSFWDNQEFQALTTRIDREVDPARRLQLVHQAEAIMEQDPPLLPVAWERINEVWYDQILFSGPERERSRSSRSIRSNSARS